MGGGKFGKLPSNFARAVDLSSLAKPPTTASSAAQNTPTIMEVTEENIVTDFIKYSSTAPVFLMIWSQRAAGSKEILDTLAKIAASDGGKWRLGAISFDSQPQLVQALGATTVPFALAFIQEKALPLPEIPSDESQLRMVISKILEIAVSEGMVLNSTSGDSDQLPSDEEISEPEEVEAFAAIETGDFEGAARAYQKLLNRKPQDPIATAGLAQCELHVRLAGVDRAQAVSAALADPSNLAAAILAADCEVAAGEFESGFSRLIAFIKSAMGDEKSAAKSHLLQLFLILPPDAPELIKARRELASALF
jgi:putative thioredoxin